MSLRDALVPTGRHSYTVRANLARTCQSVLHLRQRFQRIPRATDLAHRHCELAGLNGEFLGVQFLTVEELRSQLGGGTEPTS